MSMNDDHYDANMHFLARLASPALIDQLRARDTAQREALAHAISGRSDAQEELVRALSAHDEAKAELARVEASAATLAAAGRAAYAERDAALFQLTEVLRILDQHRAWTGMGWEQLPVPVHAVEKIRRKVAQAEQQVVGPRLVSHSEEMATCTLNHQGREYYFTLDGRSDEEAQGAQAGDERIALLERELDRERERADMAEVELQHARAALATQPAVPASVEAMSFEYAHLSGERRTVSITREDVIEGMEDALYEKLSDQICRCEPIGETNVVECNCQDYVEEFTLVSAKPAVRGAEHE